MKMKKAKRFLGILLAVIMLVSMGAPSVFAESVQNSAEQTASADAGAASEEKAAVEQKGTEAKTKKEDAKASAEQAQEKKEDASSAEEKKTVRDEKKETVKEADEKDTTAEGNKSENKESEDKKSEAAADNKKSASENADSSEQDSVKKTDAQQTDTEKTEEKTAVTYNQEPITGTKTNNGVTVCVKAPKGSFSEGTDVTITLTASSQRNVTFDITFRNKEGKEVQPKEDHPVSVDFSIAADSGLIQRGDRQTRLTAYHISDDGTSEVIGNTITAGQAVKIKTKAAHFSEFSVQSASDSRLLRAPAPKEAKAVQAAVTDLKIQNVSGQETNKVYQTDTFYLAMDWDASANGANLHAGDYFDLTLPNEMVFPSDSTAADFDIYGPDGTTVIGKAHVMPGADNKGGTVRVTFTDWVEGKEGVKGSIRLAARFDKEQIKTGEDNTFQVSVNGQVTSVTVSITGPTELQPEILGKWGQTGPDKSQAEWYIRINHQKATLSNAVITDHLSEGTGTETYIADSFVLYRVDMDSYGNVTTSYDAVDLSGKLQIAEDGRSFTLNLGDVHGEQYRLRYRTTYTAGTVLRNNMSLTSTEQSKTVSATHQTAESGGSGTGSLANKIKLIKVDAEDSSLVLANAVFTVTRPDGSTFELTTGADGTVTSGALTSGTYKVKEKEAPAGYELNQQEYTLAVNASGGAIQTVTDKKLKIDISITKKWDDSQNQDGIRPSAEAFASKVKLMNGTGEVSGYTPAVTDNGDDTYTISYRDLPEYVNGTKADYKIAEESIDGYTADQTSAANGETITNTHTPETTDISITKMWADAGNQDGIRPTAEEYAAKVHLMKGDTEVKNVTPVVVDHGDDTYTVTFRNLPKNQNGTAIAYTVKEDSVAGYEADHASVPGDGTITNTHTPETTEISGTKTWKDNDNQDGTRPESITIRLLANGKEVQSRQVTASDDWAWSFHQLPKYENGTAIVYSVTEDAVADYSTAYDGYDVTNIHTPGKTSVSVSKSWNDKNDVDKIRPEQVTIHLLADGKDTGKTLVLNSDNKWTGSFTDLDIHANGKKIEYTVTEDAVDGYHASITGSSAKGYTVTNTHKITRKPDKPKVKPTTPKHPKKTTTTESSGSTPKTGDTNRGIFFGILLAAALAGLGVLILAARKRNS